MKKKLPRFLSLIFVLSLIITFGNAQEIKEISNFTLTNQCDAINNANYTVTYQSKGKLYTLKNFEFYKPESNLLSKSIINPTASSTTVLYNKKNYFDVLSLKDRSSLLYTIKDKRKHLAASPRLICGAYSPDARSLMLSNNLGEILTYSTEDYTLKDVLTTSKTYNLLFVSPNIYYVLGAVNDTLDIWNIEKKSLRTEIKVLGKINDVSFSDDSRVFAVGYNGGIDLYDAASMKLTSTIAKGKNITSVSIHPNGKYLAYSDGTLVTIFNIKNNTCVIESSEFAGNNKPNDGVSHVRILKSNNESFSLLNSATGKVTFWDISGLPPYYSQIMSEDIENGMNEWMKIMDGETEEEYKARINDENAAIHRAKLKEEFATGLAMGAVTFTAPLLGESYNVGNQSIMMSFAGANPIEMKIPENEIANIQDGKFTLSETAFSINDKDEIVFSYLVLTSSVTGASYIYDNREYIRLEDMFGEKDINYIPVNIRQTAAKEKESLLEQKDFIVDESRTKNLITDNTTISVNSSIKTDYDADGNKIFNYNVNYMYEVSKEFSEVEDFASGKYKIEESNAGMTMLKACKTAFENELSNYVGDASSVEIFITGTADAKPVKLLSYGDEYGTYKDYPYYNNKILSSVTLNSETDITSNEQLAFARALSAKDWIVRNIDVVNNNLSKFDFKYNTNVSEQEGSEFRRIIVDITIKNVFKQ